MAKPVFSYSAIAAVALACSSPVGAQEARDPLTRFLDGFFKDTAPPARTGKPEAPAPRTKAEPKAASSSAASPPRPAARPAAPVDAPPTPTANVAQVPRKPAQAEPASPAGSIPAPRPAARPAAPVDAPPTPAANVAQVPRKPAQAEPASPAAPIAQAPRGVERKPAPENGVPSPAAAKAVVNAAAPAQPVLAAPAAAAQPAAATVRPVPTSTAAAIDRVNSYFNTIDQLTASFVQTSAAGQAMSGTLALKRPGQLRFAYAAPSTLEVVSDGRSVAVRDKKLGTNDVYPVGQTPLKFLLKDDFDLARDTKVQDVQIARDGLVTVSFEDSTTFGGTSKVRLRFDARAGRLVGWTVLDPQGFETTVTLSDVNVVQRPQGRAVN